MIRKHIPVLMTIAVAAALAAPAPASAATSCAHTVPGVLQVGMSQNNDQLILDALPDGRIRTLGAGGDVTCTGTAPTTTNVDTILVLDESDDPATVPGNDGATQVSIDDPAQLGPGRTSEGTGVGEIEVLVDTGAGRDSLTLGGRAKQQLVAGSNGVGWNADQDADLVGVPFDTVFLHGADGADYLSAQGGAGTGAPLASAEVLHLQGGNSGDVLLGGDGAGGDRIRGGEGADTVGGGGGDDSLSPGPGDDTVRGGDGVDTAAFGGAVQAVTVDLAQAGAQDTGEGLDSFTGTENALGSGFPDRLSGDAGANVLSGGHGEDVLEGRGGADELLGDTGADSVSYAGSPVAVNVDLARTTQSTDGDKLTGVEDVVGSPFADMLAGSPGANRIVGGAGADTVTAGDGADRIEVRDSQGDRASCGPGPDAAISDRRSVDSLNPDCESVDALPEAFRPVAQPGGAPAGRRAVAAPRCAGRRATMVGTAGRDVLRGTRRADVIVALGGNDRVIAARGNDVVCAGAGADKVDGGAGADRLFGGAGRDRLGGGSGRDACAGGPSRDRVRCERGR